MSSLSQMMMMDYQSFSDTTTTNNNKSNVVDDDERTAGASTHAGKETVVPTAGINNSPSAQVPLTPSPITSTTTSSYRGFSTSISSIYSDDTKERIDCCSTICCGILQYDHNRYIVSRLKNRRQQQFNGTTGAAAATTTSTGVIDRHRRRRRIQNKRRHNQDNDDDDDDTNTTMDDDDDDNILYPPSIMKRVLVHFLIPFCLFMAAGLGALHIQDVIINEMISTLLILLLVLYIVIQCQKGRYKRIKVRDNILRIKYDTATTTEVVHQQQQQQQQQDRTVTTTTIPAPQQLQQYGQGQTVQDIKNAHPFCNFIGCYRVDDTIEYSNNNNNSSSSSSDVTNPCHRRHHLYSSSNLCHCLYDTICPSCCYIDGGWYYIQCCGICAIAQEGREIDILLHDDDEKLIALQRGQEGGRGIPTSSLLSSYRYIDYLTMESMMLYYPAIYQYRQFNHRNKEEEEEQSSSLQSNDDLYRNHKYKLFRRIPVSKLSYRIVQSLLVFWCFMFVWCTYGSSYYFTYIIGRHTNIKHQFGIFDYCIMIGTFVQSFILLGVWYYCIDRLNRSTTPNTASCDVSMDALIKYFASGFFLSASLALFWEMFVVAIINTFITLILSIVGIDRVVTPQSDQSNNNNVVLNTIFNTNSGSNSIYLTSISSSPTLVNRMYNTNAMDVRTNAAAGVNRTDYATLFGMDHPILYTIYILIATFLVAGLIEEMCKYYGYRMVQHPDFLTRDELESISTIVRNESDDGEDDNDDEGSRHNDPTSYTNLESPTISSKNNNRTIDRLRSQSGMTTTHHSFPNQRVSVQGRGAAITIAMVSVAIGFACCENLIYIFHYAGESIALELGVLLERSCFPIHPILAAIQSINVCYRELEQHHLNGGVRNSNMSMKVGRIILPAVLFHGTFDFFIIFIGFIGKLLGQEEEEGDLQISNGTELLSILACLIIMSLSLYYLYSKSNQQRQRLMMIDMQTLIGVVDDPSRFV